MSRFLCNFVFVLLQGNNILEITGTNPVTDSSGWFTVFLPENLKEACVEPEETTTNVTFPAYSFISNDSGYFLGYIFIYAVIYLLLFFEKHNVGKE